MHLFLDSRVKKDSNIRALEDFETTTHIVIGKLELRFLCNLDYENCAEGFASLAAECFHRAVF
jgi:hypothetical protein